MNFLFPLRTCWALFGLIFFASLLHVQAVPIEINDDIESPTCFHTLQEDVHEIWQHNILLLTTQIDEIICHFDPEKISSLFETVPLESFQEKVAQTKHTTIFKIQAHKTPTLYTLAHYYPFELELDEHYIKRFSIQIQFVPDDNNQWVEVQVRFRPSTMSKHFTTILEAREKS